MDQCRAALLGGVPSLTRDDPAAFAPPPSFGPFRVLHQIGVGALGPVFRTYEPTRDRLIAVKVFRLDVTPEQAQALAEDLSKAAEAGLFHPSIVEPVAAGVEGTVAYRAEEYVAAESLDAAIRHYAPASLDKALPFITQLAGAIDFARAAGVGHGALHLRDIFVTPDDARASGFGVVEALERQGLRAPVRRPYSAPERIAGQPWGTPADVFSLAAIAFELLTGRRPSGTGGRIGDVSGDNLGGHADMIHSVLARAMDDDPALRHPSALGFASALEAAARGERVTGAMEQVGAISGMAVPIAAAQPPSTGHAGPHVDHEVDILGDDEIDEAVFVEADGAGELDSLDSESEPGVEEAAAALLLDPEVYENFDDIAADGELDEANALVSMGDDLGETDARERTLFDEDEDEDEAAEDLAFAAGLEDERETTPAPQRSEAPVAFAAADQAFDDGYAEEHEDMRGGAVVEPPRRAMLPLALTGILCLLIGFAAAYAIFGRTPAAVPPGTAAPEAQAEPGSAAGGTAPGPERPYSEQVVTPPPVVPEAPPPDAPGEPATAAPAPTSGTLVVRSTPSNAVVTVNGKWSGRTPLTLDDLGFGQYAVRVIQDGFEVAQEDVRLSAEDPAGAINVRLARRAQPPARPAPASQRAAPRASYTGAIYVDSRPRGARVLVDGKPVGVTPLRLPDVTIGSHVVRLELEGHRTWTSSTRVAAGQEARVTGSLEQIR